MVAVTDKSKYLIVHLGHVEDACVSLTATEHVLNVEIEHGSLIEDYKVFKLTPMNLASKVVSITDKE